MNRHWVWLAVGMALGIAVAAALPGDAYRFGLALLAPGLAAALIRGRFPGRTHLFAALLAFACGALLWAMLARAPSDDPLFRLARNHPGSPCTLEGRVAEAPLPDPGAKSLGFVLRDIVLIRQDTRQPMGAACLVRWNDPAGTLFDGERVRLSGMLYPDLGDVNHGLRGYEEYCRNRGIQSRVAARGNTLQRLSPGNSRPDYWVSRLRAAQAERLRRVAPGAAWPFVAGVWLGERSGLGGEALQRYVLSGTAHILSVSGLHVGLIYLSLAALLAPMARFRRTRAALLLLAVFLYALMTGARPATLRAAFMVAVFLAYDFFERESDGWSALGLSGVLQLAADPAVLYDTGFQLSYLCMGSLFLYEPLISARLTLLPRMVRGPLATTLSAQLLVLPAAAWQFSVIPLAGLLANLVVVPLLSVVLWLAMAVTPLLWLCPPLAKLPAAALWPAVAGIEWAVRLGAAIPGGHLLVTRPNPAALLLYFAAALAFWTALKAEQRTGRRWTAAACLLALSLVLWPLRTQPPRIDFLDVGHADAALIVTPGGSRILVDGGDLGYGGDDGQRIVLPFLRAQGIHRLDAVVATHGDSDHLGGLLRVVAALPVDAAWLPPESGPPQELEREFLALCAQRGVPVHRVTAGDPLPAKGAEVTLLHPPAKDMGQATENDRSLVLEVAWPRLSVLLAGDIEQDGERRLARQPCAAAVLKAPHHGSATSNSDALLDAVHPAAVVISTRATSRWPATGKGVLERYRARGVTIWRTDWHGGLRLRVRNGQMVMDSARARRGCVLAPDG